MQKYSDNKKVIDDAVNKKGYKINDGYFGGDTGLPEEITGLVDEVWSNVIQNLLKKGKVSQNAFMGAINESEEVKTALKKDFNDGYIDLTEMTEMAKILRKIYDSLEKGITVTAER